MREKTLIPPVPKEYASYTDQEKIEKTEQYYKNVSELYTRIEGIEEEHKKRMNTVLEARVKTEDLLTVLSEEEVQMLCHYVNEFALLNLFCRIATTEEIFHEISILQNIRSLEEVANRYLKYMFLIRRFEFDWEEDSELSDLVKQGKLSYIMLSELICVKEVVRKVHAGCRIAEYLHRNGCRREAMLFIMRLEQKLPYSERKVMNIATTLLDMGEKQLAYEVLMKHQNPNEDIKELQDALSKML